MSGVVADRERLPVVVGVGDVPDGLRVIDVAAAEASYRDVPLEIVHASPDAVAGRRLLEVAAGNARRARPELRVWTELAGRSASVELVERSGRACLVVVGDHGRDTTAAYLAQHCRCPLLVHRGPHAWHGPVVVGVSGRHSATVGTAYEAASRAGSLLVAVHVAAPGESGAGRLAVSLAGWTTRWPGVTTERLLISEPDVAYTVERAGRRGRLLVAGRGEVGWTAELIHSISAGSRGMCPVLLVPPGWGVTRPGGNFPDLDHDWRGNASTPEPNRNNVVPS
ncbi:universal stress protein [Actinoplanes sp. NPDC051861]|uniref:universal stress protein n=1 Tax=Actinoplanes sp. NPDC051861 TaxID=3155170 RepID=UPI00341D51AC